MHGTDQTTAAAGCRAGAVLCAPAGSLEVADILRTSAQGCAHFKRGRPPGCAGAACPRMFPARRHESALVRQVCVISKHLCRRWPELPGYSSLLAFTGAADFAGDATWR